MRKYNVEEFAELMNIKTDYDINDINELLLTIEEKGANIWSYAPEDVDEIKDFSIIVLVYDKYGDIRYFENIPTEIY